MAFDFTPFRGITEYLMTDKMTVKRPQAQTEDEYGATIPGGVEVIYEDVKCRVSQINQNFNNPNAEEVDNIPVLYKLKVFAPHNIVIEPGDLITLTRTVNGAEKTYKDKRASDYMQYDNHIEFYIGIDEEA